MPEDLLRHVEANSTWRDDVFLFGVYGPLAALTLLVLASLWVVCAPIDWMIQRCWRD